jgi:hypothetical protein
MPVFQGGGHWWKSSRGMVGEEGGSDDPLDPVIWWAGIRSFCQRLTCDRE